MISSTIQALLTDESQAFIQKHQNEIPEKLLFKKYPDSLPIKAIVHQLKSRQKIKEKLPSWYADSRFIFPSKVSIEQCSSEKTALYKSRLITQGKKMVDLTGGMGIDFMDLSQCFEEAIYVEQEQELTTLAKHNFAIAACKGVTIVRADATDYLKQLEPIDFVFIDPHRRDDTNQKIVLLESCLPNVVVLQHEILQKAKSLLIKASPMLAIKQAIQSLHFVKEVHVVSVKNECKELLFLMEKSWTKAPQIIASNILSQKTVSFRFTYAEEESYVTETSKAQHYLYLPNNSITKAGAFKSIAKRFLLRKLHKNSHIYTSTDLIADFPGRIFELEEEIGYTKAKQRLKEKGIQTATIIIRNFKDDIGNIRKKLKVKKEGKNILFATTNVDERQVILLCKEYVCDQSD